MPSSASTASVDVDVDVDDPDGAPSSARRRTRPSVGGRLFRQATRRARHHRPRLLWLHPVQLLVALSWMLVLWWGEHRAYGAAIERCQWRRWEDWPANAQPHHLLLIADPQLVDPHTYPGRRWPLSRLTTIYTDRYMHRAFRALAHRLQPDTVIFLGDLLDGGREWATSTSTSTSGSRSADPRWHRYGPAFWMAERARFERIFVRAWTRHVRTQEKQQQPHAAPRVHKLIASLPGNHDVGFGNGVGLAVRARFETWFGPGNRVDVVGNHSVVGLDTVSLSARPAHASPNADVDPDPDPDVEARWRPAQAFLDTLPARKRRALARVLVGREPARAIRWPHRVRELELGDLAAPTAQPPLDTRIHRDYDQLAALPTILLTHVPLYRAPGTPCGPLRERWPPSASASASSSASAATVSDDGNAIAVRAGYQYQNVLGAALSREIIDKAGREEDEDVNVDVDDGNHDHDHGRGRVGSLVRVFSGDDHDYCEVVHRRRPHKAGGGGGVVGVVGAVREITVKSISWAMGVRRPGVVLVSLWNPIDGLGRPLPSTSTSAPATTIQSQLCLLPDQLAIFMRYGAWLALTLLVLVARAVVVAVVGSGGGAGGRAHSHRHHDDNDGGEKASPPPPLPSSPSPSPSPSPSSSPSHRSDPEHKHARHDEHDYHHHRRVVSSHPYYSSFADPAHRHPLLPTTTTTTPARNRYRPRRLRRPAAAAALLAAVAAEAGRALLPVAAVVGLFYLGLGWWW
ncbi:MAG: hypothetical protein M1826_001429 [Phylliscum demangeonii]|nr:MAG: hypothetical protein M1826_001429 [Phylliscum demangeonii]